MTEAAVSTPKVGDRIWFFDENRRRYRDGESRPIWREHWRPFYIVGENRVSWLLTTSLGGVPFNKCPKKRKGIDMKRWAFSEEEIDELEWDSVHRHRIIDKARYDLTTAQLREIAKMIGYATNGDDA